MKFSMNESSYEEYEEVESPYSSVSPKVSLKNTDSSDSFSFRKNVFSRPFASESSHAPTYVDSPLRAEQSTSDVLFNSPVRLENSLSQKRRSFDRSERLEEFEKSKKRISTLNEDDIEYLENSKIRSRTSLKSSPKISKKSSSKTFVKPQNHFLTKASLIVLGSLVLRLIFMDRGVWDYFSTEALIKSKEQEYQSIIKENEGLKNEIVKIKTDSNYQKHLAKEHLGVIASDEFLILFAGGTATSAVAGLDAMLED